MTTASQFLRTTAAVAAICALGAGPAAARESDVPRPHTPPTHVQFTPSGIPPRVDGMGVQPDKVTRVAAPAHAPAALSVTTSGSGGFDWLSAGIGALALLAAGLVVVIVRSSHGSLHRRATPPAV